MNLYEKLMEIRTQLREIEIPKSGKNKFGGFNYFELEDIIPPITQLCRENNVFTCVSFDHEIATLRAIDIEKPKDIIEITSPMPELVKQDRMNIIQSVGSFETYQRRYLYIAMFDIMEKDTIDALDNNKENNNQVNKKRDKNKQKTRPDGNGKKSNGFKTADKLDEFKDDPVSRNFLIQITKTLKETNQNITRFNIVKEANRLKENTDNDVDEQMVKRLVELIHKENIK